MNWVSNYHERRTKGRQQLQHNITQTQEILRKRKQRNRILSVVLVTLLFVCFFTGAYYLWSKHQNKLAQQAEIARLNKTFKACSYEFSSDTPQVKGHHPGKPKSDWVPRSGEALVTFNTSQGTIPITLTHNTAPCGTHSIEFLIEHKYFNKTNCHREVKSPYLTVLQCGAVMSGNFPVDAGYSTPQETPRSLQPISQIKDLKKLFPTITPPEVQRLTQSSTVFYPAGTVALAGSSPTNVSGSEFFFVTKDSILPPYYPVIGKIHPSGMKVLQNILHKGITAPPGSPPEALDGAPAQPVVFHSVTLTHK